MSLRHLAFAVACLSTPATLATTLEVVSGTRSGTISVVDPIGQSFVAPDSQLTSFGFQFQSLNPSQPNDPITFTLRAGEGLNGAIVTTRSVTLPTTVSGRTSVWYDFDLSGTAVSAGSLYTALLTTTASTRNALVFGPNLNISTGQPLTGDAYAPGRLVFAADPDANSYCTRSGTCDASFRVTGIAAAVPEPAAWTTLVAGFGLLGTSLRRRRAPALA